MVILVFLIGSHHFSSQVQHIGLKWLKIVFNVAAILSNAFL